MKPRDIYFKTAKSFESYKDYLEEYILKTFPATYYVDTNELDCERGRRRSVLALYQLCRSFDKTLKYREFANTLNKLCIKYKIYIYYCSTVNKPVLTLFDGIRDDDYFMDTISGTALYKVHMNGIFRHKHLYKLSKILVNND